MKKISIAILGTALAAAVAIPAVAFGMGGVQAQANPLPGRVCAAIECANAQGACVGTGACYVDADGDGVCDNYAGRGGNGAGYVDADGDGVCDNYGTGVGNGVGNGNGAGNGGGYVDADGDGVCDNYGTGNGYGNGNGAGNGSGAGNGARGHHGGGHHGARCF